MSWRDYATAMAAYNRWMNERLYALCQGLSEEERTRDLGAFFGSVHNTLDHILWADEALLVRLGHESLKIERYSPPMIADFAALSARRAEVDQSISNWAQTVDDDEIAEPYEFVSVLYGKSTVVPRYVVAMHLFNHQTHHRGQVTTLLSQLGHDVGITDLPWVPDTAS
ncbi:MAG: DinB family protein [Polyangiales bacterium]